MAADPSAVIIWIGDTDVTQFARVGRVRIDDLLNDAPNTAALTVVLAPRIAAPQTGPFARHAFDAGAFNTNDNRGPVIYPPTVNVGARILMWVNGGADQIFGGEITAREQYAEFDQPQHVRLDLTCIDFTRALNRRKVVKEYGQQSATAIVLDVIALYAPWISTANVQAGLGTITGGITFTFEEVSRALSRIAEKIGAYWYVDYSGSLHFFIGTEAGPAPAPIVPGGRFSDLKITADLSQVRTRIIIEGDGGTAVLTLPAGDAITPISQTTPFNPAGGMAKIGPARVTYTGIHAGGIGGPKTNTTGPVSGGTPDTPGGPPPAPPGAPTVAVASATTTGKLSGGPYYYAVTFELSDGSRSDLGAAAGPVTITGAGAPPLTTAALMSPQAKGPIAVGVASVYATSFVAANGDETAATQFTPGGGTVTGRPVADPPATIGISTIPGAGTIAPGYYDYAVTFLTPAGETLPAFFRNVFISAASANRITLPTSSDGRIVGRRIYRSSVAATVNTTTLPWHHVIDIAGNATAVSTYDDTVPDNLLATLNYPAVTSATDVGEAATVNVPTSTLSTRRARAISVYCRDPR